MADRLEANRRPRERFFKLTPARQQELREQAQAWAPPIWWDTLDVPDSAVSMTPWRRLAEEPDNEAPSSTSSG